MKRESKESRRLISKKKRKRYKNKNNFKRIKEFSNKLKEYKQNQMDG